MKERLSSLVERSKDSLNGVLKAASKTATLVFNEVRKNVTGDLEDPRAVGNAGLSYLFFGPLNGIAYSISAVQSPISHEALAVVTFYSGVVTGASALIGINLIRKARGMLNNY